MTCLVKVINLNKPDSPCVEADQDYSFTQCVRVFINQKIGCRIKYDGVLGSDLRECQSPEEIGCVVILKLKLLWTSEHVFRSYLELQSELIDLTKSELEDVTRCRPPCSYYRYQVVSKLPGENGYGTKA